VTFEGDDTRWLQMANSGQFTPDGITDIPENSTLEFDLYVDDNYSFYSGGLYINVVEVSDKTKDFMRWDRLNGVRLWLHPVEAGGGDDLGRMQISNIVEGGKIIENRKSLYDFTKNKNLVHVSIWRQKTRIRIYIDDTKIWDLPRAFADANYNSLVLSTGKGNDDSHFYVANLRLAVAGEDKRHSLLETGHFETNEILFDVGLSSLQMGSTAILDELGQLLEEHTDFNLSIVGHTDADGASESNQKLSEDRARSVKEYLTDNYAIKGSRLQTEGRGASVPVDTNDTEEGKQNNRRVEFIKM
jgi:outer membrane protein OmpA-like peptidoglycan-associated protein